MLTASRYSEMRYFITVRSASFCRTCRYIVSIAIAHISSIVQVATVYMRARNKNEMFGMVVPCMHAPSCPPEILS